jgi:hypothetical protein
VRCRTVAADTSPEDAAALAHAPNPIIGMFARF